MKTVVANMTKLSESAPVLSLLCRIRTAANFENIVRSHIKCFQGLMISYPDAARSSTPCHNLPISRSHAQKPPQDCSNSRAEADGEAHAAEPVRPRNASDTESAKFLAELERYNVKLQGLEQAREKRQLEITTFKEHMEQTRLIYRSACAKLDLDPENPVIGTGDNQISLKPWEVRGLKYLVNDIPEPLRGHMPNDDRDLGRTLLDLELINTLLTTAIPIITTPTFPPATTPPTTPTTAVPSTVHSLQPTIALIQSSASNSHSNSNSNPSIPLPPFPVEITFTPSKHLHSSSIRVHNPPDEIYPRTEDHLHRIAK